MPLNPIGECPEGTGMQKFISESGEGLRGKLIAVHENKRNGIVLVLNSADEGRPHWGQLALVWEDEPNEWPKFIKIVHNIPDEERWDIPGPIMEGSYRDTLRGMFGT